MFAGKTGSSQIKKFTELQRESEVKQNEIVYGDRDHAWFVAFAPYEKPEVAVSVIIEHGGHGGDTAAPIAGEVLKTYFSHYPPSKTIGLGKERLEVN